MSEETDSAAAVKRLRKLHFRYANYRGSDRSRACDKGEHGECDGSVTIIDQDGHSRYTCSCSCHTTYDCSVCKRRWPCDVVVVLDALEASANRRPA